MISGSRHTERISRSARANFVKLVGLGSYKPNLTYIMALGDIILSAENVGSPGGRLYNVAAGTPIYAGEPVMVRALGNTVGKVVEPAITSTPVVGTDSFVGIASTSSTNTTAAAGTVNVTPLDPRLTYLANPDVTATWDTQTEYDALVSARVLLKNSVSITATPTSGTYTILASDSANNGCVVQPLNVFVTPGKVAFAFRAGASYLA